MFAGEEFRKHTSCVSEEEKYQEAMDALEHKYGIENALDILIGLI